ncbi:MAG: hypothetical protein F4147_07920 [Gammaproteobacteria bacterium]|nr:hypothetical protein [Gammaproteobacteria bacterium]
MTPVLEIIINQSPVLAALVVMFYVLNQKIENLSKRLDDMNKRFDDTHNRLDDLRDDYKTLSAKVDTIAAEVYRIEGHLNLPRTGTDS